MFTLQQLKQQYTAYAKQHIFDNQPTGLYEPINYILNLGGKRLRPVLVLMSCNLFSENVEKALPAAHAIEIFHNFTLVHDDIMDEAPLRRGKPTIHTKYNVNTGILSGDTMFAWVYEYLLKVEPSLLKDIIQVFNQVAIGVCEGQQYDIDFETAAEVTLEAYLKMIELKTSVLLAGAMKIGALIGGADAEAATHLEEFGRNIGIAFQLQDDILDTYGDPKKFGKKVGGDIAQNKKTVLVIKALELATPDIRQQLLQLLSTKPADEKSKIKAVVAIFNQLEVKEQTATLKEFYRAKAHYHLDQVAVATEKKAALRGFADFLVHRTV